MINGQKIRRLWSPLFWLTAFIFLIAHSGFSQLPGFEKIRITVPGEGPVFKKAVMDADGYIWLGSGQGLFRFDGIQFKSFTPLPDTADFHVTALHLDQDHDLWIGCRDGKIYRLDQGRINLFNPEEGTSGVAVTDILVAQDRSIWWSTAGEGIYFYSGTRVFNINRDDGLPDDYVHDLESVSDGYVVAGTDGGLVSCIYRNGEKIVNPLAASGELPDIMVTVVKEDSDGNLWLGFQDGGIGFLTNDGRQFIQPAADHAWEEGPVSAVTVSGASAWAGTSSGELLEISLNENNRGMINLLPADLQTGKIYDLLEDREGNIWILSAEGLFRSTGNRIRYLDDVGGIPLANIHAIHADEFRPGLLWFSDDRGLFSLAVESGDVKSYPGPFKGPGLKITCLNQDRFGYIWAGTFNYGAIRLNPANGTFDRITERDNLVNNNVLSISRHHDTLWMATLGGASEIILDPNTSGRSYQARSYNYENGLVNNFIYYVYEDDKNRIWLATDGDGINVRTQDGWSSYNENNGLTDDVIYSLTGDKYGNIWAGSASGGLFKFDGKNFIHYGLDEGLSSISFTGIMAADDELLAVHENGLDILHIPTGNIAHYGGDKGFEGIQPDLNTISRDSEGNIWLGTRKGIIRYRPGSAVSYMPVTVLEEMSVYLEPRELKAGQVFGYADNHISFRYAGLWFSNPERVNYQVMLEGYDLGWNDTYNRQVTYSSLPPGEFTFKVRSSLDRSFVNAGEVSYSFRIRQPVWIQPWFIILLVIILAALIFLYIKMRENRLRKREQEKKEKIEFEFQVLKNQVNPHFLFNSFSTLISLIEDNPEQAVQYTEKLSDFFRTILQYKDQELITLDEELTLIQSYFFLLKKRYGDNLYLDIQLGDELKKAFIPPMTLQILIENAVKHNVISMSKPLFIKVYEDDGKIVVENNLQPKLTPEVSTGIGLENIRKRYKLITDKEVIIEISELLFRIFLPLIK